MDNQTIVNSLDQLLQGTYMGISFFEDLKNLTKNQRIHSQFEEILSILSQHKTALSKAILFYHGEVNEEKLSTMMGEMMSKFKNLMLSDEGSILGEAAKGIDMGIKQLKDFNDQNFALAPAVAKDIKIMDDDYQSIKHQIHKLFIEFQG